MTGAQPLTYLRAIRDDRELTTAEKMIALMIMSHAGADGRRSHPGTAKLAAETGLHRNTINPATKKLVEKKWLIQTYSGYGGARDKANEYDLNIPGEDSMHTDCALGDSQSSSQGTMDPLPRHNGPPPKAQWTPSQGTMDPLPRHNGPPPKAQWTPSQGTPIVQLMPLGLMRFILMLFLWMPLGLRPRLSLRLRLRLSLKSRPPP